MAGTGADNATDTKDIKELEKKLKDANEFSAKFPEEQGCEKLAEKLEAQLLEARPQKAVQTSELQKELEDIEKAIEDVEKKDSQKRDWLAKKLEEVRKQRGAICTGILQKQARVKSHC